MSGYVVAMDGPGGSGKTTIARSIAMQLELPHLDTGAYYRAATVAVLRAGLNPEDSGSVVDLVEGLDLQYAHGRMMLDGDDVSDEIRSEATTLAVSAVSAIAPVRERLVTLQREWVTEHGGSAVVEGRDIGTVVFPDASLKLFITARPDVRAMRRAGEIAGDRELIRQDLARRDTIDSSRSVAPLQRADDAIEIDTSDLSIDEVISQVLNLVRRR
ncbi:MAG: (d)CMP kinase [Acidimicrobiia bacterium]|nr:(d)CMP kinase [Acidimicrobiia bacterium]